MDVGSELPDTAMSVRLFLSTDGKGLCSVLIVRVSHSHHGTLGDLFSQLEMD